MKRCVLSLSLQTVHWHHHHTTWYCDSERYIANVTQINCLHWLHKVPQQQATLVVCRNNTRYKRHYCCKDKTMGDGSVHSDCSATCWSGKLKISRMLCEEQKLTLHQGFLQTPFADSTWETHILRFVHSWPSNAQQFWTPRGWNCIKPYELDVQKLYLKMYHFAVRVPRTVRWFRTACEGLRSHTIRCIWSPEEAVQSHKLLSPQF